MIDNPADTVIRCRRARRKKSPHSLREDSKTGTGEDKTPAGSVTGTGQPDLSGIHPGYAELYGVIERCETHSRV